MTVQTRTVRRWLLAATVWAMCAAATWAADGTKRLLLIGQGPDNHPAGTHEYLAGVERLAKLLEPVAGLEVSVVQADEPWPEGPALLDKADGAVIFLSEGAKWCVADPRRHDALARLAARGGGLACLHWAMGTRGIEPIEPFLQLFGACHGGPDRKYQVVRSELRPAEPVHAIAARLRPLAVRDEFYYRLKLAQDSSVEPVMHAVIDGQPEMVAWAWQRPDGGRSFGFSGLHFDDNWQLPEYQQLVGRGVRWTMKLPLE